MANILKFKRDDGLFETVEKETSIVARLGNGVVEKRIITKRSITTPLGKIIEETTEKETIKIREF